mgnify:FL=1
MKDLQDTLKTACQNYSIQESTMELLMASASQIQKRKSSVKSNTESYHPALRTFALTLHLYSAQAYRLVKHSLSSIKRRGEGGWLIQQDYHPSFLTSKIYRQQTLDKIHELLFACSLYTKRKCS